MNQDIYLVKVLTYCRYGVDAEEEDISIVLVYPPTLLLSLTIFGRPAFSRHFSSVLKLGKHPLERWSRASRDLRNGILLVHGILKLSTTWQNLKHA